MFYTYGLSYIHRRRAWGPIFLRQNPGKMVAAWATMNYPKIIHYLIELDDGNI